MKASKALIIAIVCLLFSGSSLVQSQDFDLAEYQQFLEQHRNMTTSELLQMHPTGDFVDDVNVPWESITHSDLVEEKYTLTDNERSLIRKNGFVVTERLRMDSFIEQFRDIRQKDLPLFISTDAILHAFHFYYDKILKDVELGIIVERLTTMLSELHNKLPDLAAKYSTDSGMDQMLRDVDVYLTVPRKLLGQTVSPYYPDNAVEIDQILSLIEAEGYATYPIFSEDYREIDFSQFKPRGHYTESEELQRYFRTMMWLGRIEIYLLSPEAASVVYSTQLPEDIKRQTIDAVLILELMDIAGVSSLYDEIEDILSFLVGEQDNVTPPNLKSVTESINLQDASQLLDPMTLQLFQDTLKIQGFAFQRILSQILRHDPSSPDSIQPASAFMLFGQRFVIDSYVTGNVVFDKIVYDDNLIYRMFPSTLDILFAFGNNAAAPPLIPELDQYHYSANLAGLRYLIDSYDTEFWDSSIYNMWLDSIRALNMPSDRSGLPKFMQTEAWWRQKMNTQLSSWTELRHDDILYVKQSYTAGAECSFPSVYVEPFPESYQCLSDLAKKAYDKFVNLPFSDSDIKTSILDYFDLLESVTDTLATIARKELAQESLSPDELTFMDEIFYNIWTGGGSGWGSYVGMAGWYLELLYGPSFTPGTLDGPFSDYLVVDYHTTPTDSLGNLVGWISHAGTGPVDIAIVTATVPDANTAAFVGPVMSYYEYRTTGFYRLTDEEWENTYLQLAARPEWTDLYLADSLGE
jgi:hypothetical protein